MLFVGNQRGGGRDLALHLLQDDNERVEVHDIRGFASNDLESAFKESYAISRATKCKQHLFSLSINPPPIENANDADFEEAIERAEKTLGLTGQPRAIVFHDKKGRDGEVRRHAHAVWCRIDTDEMKAKQLSFTKTKLMELSRELYLEHDWRMPPGMLHKPDRDPRNFSLEQWQQAKRAKKDPQKIIGIFQDCWSVSDSAASFGHALAEHGYVLAKGRRGFVGVDHEGEVYSVSKWTKRKTKDVRKKLGTTDNLPSVEQAHTQAAQRITDRLKEIRAQQAQAEEIRLERLAQARQRQRELQEVSNRKLLEDQRQRQSTEATEREARLRKGLLGVWDRLTGQRKRTLEENAREAIAARERDNRERTAIYTRQQQAQSAMAQRKATLKTHYEKVQTELKTDITRIMPPPEEERIQSIQDRLRQNRQRHRTRTRNRDGPNLER